ncbi:hypothetical protein [Paramagnetospirillum marisnigri]|uniref:hypothetical protein n=1 Tax=Paramagnetospirillum marisnigri TaxID=1285242 RepID=UPI0012E91CDC|nr:hypothetical protein [Paramagnetospirillum marisnigri]
MGLRDSFIGKEARALDSYIKKAKIAGLVEIETVNDLNKLDDIKKSIKNIQSANHLVVVYKFN